MIDETIRCMHTLLNKDHRLIITDLQVWMATQFSHQASRGTIYTALIEHLTMSKVCARWVSGQLTDDNRTLRMGRVLEFLIQYHMKRNELIECIVKGDESWIHFWTPETKAQSKEWKKKEEDTTKKFKTVPLAGKVMLTIFWDCRGPFYWKFGDDGKGRVTQHKYFDTMLHISCVHEP